ncbi:MAG: hypothetical protein KZQ98_02745 [Candidatus Thiodiazotropha sp. (ex Lucinoma borealis)]|nr:hypothetical protein [Candidatus Thiodiazotropha sp. (ex Lucinoma borealis)]
MNKYIITLLSVFFFIGCASTKKPEYLTIQPPPYVDQQTMLDVFSPDKDIRDAALLKRKEDGERHLMFTTLQRECAEAHGDVMRPNATEASAIGAGTLAASFLMPIVAIPALGAAYFSKKQRAEDADNHPSCIKLKEEFGQ